MRRSGFYPSIVWAAVLLGAVAVQGAPATEPGDAPTVVTLAIDPMGEPSPAFRYRLRVHYMDQTPGNAAMQYHTALVLYLQASKPEDADKISEWLALPPAEMPADAVRELLDRYGTALKITRLAARCEECEWDYPIRSQGLETLLPALSPFRTLAKLVALKARLAIARGELNAAIDDIQTGFGMAHHACDSPILIGDLVGYAVARIMSQQVLAWIQASKAGNLYWALADLPAPFKDSRLLPAGEEAWLCFSVPALGESDKKLSTEEWNRVAAEVQKILDMSEPGKGKWERQLSAAAIALKLYPQAKKDLIASGHDAKEVEAMPAQQVVLMAGYEAYVRLRDDMFKWFSLPYWQARPGLAEVERRLNAAAGTWEGYPFMQLLPALTRVLYTTTRLDRELAALRCIEAIRLYTAANGGQLPASLGQITAVPVPVDPITGKEFVYRVEDGKATLTAPRPEGEPLKEETQYVITVRKP